VLRDAAIARLEIVPQAKQAMSGVHTMQWMINADHLCALTCQLGKTFGTGSGDNRMGNLHNLHIVSALKSNDAVVIHLVGASRHFI
jgi:hypothetical protein